MTRHLIAVVAVIVAAAGWPTAVLAKDGETTGAVVPIEKVRPLHTDNYEKIVGADEDWLIRFFSPSCGVCKETHKIWEEAVELIDDSSVKYGVVDCLEDPELCRIFSIEWYPTIKRLSHNQVYEFSGAPSNKEEIVEFAKSGWAHVDPVALPKVGDKVKSGSSMTLIIFIVCGCILTFGYALVRLTSSPKHKKKGGLLD